MPSTGERFVIIPIPVPSLTLDVIIMVGLYRYRNLCLGLDANLGS
jgi:hypothetical protein